MSFYRRRSDPMLPHYIARKYIYMRWDEDHYLRVAILKWCMSVSILRYGSEDHLMKHDYDFNVYPECKHFHDGTAWDVLSVVSFIHFHFRPLIVLWKGK
jgi:hypothetical protein